MNRPLSVVSGGAIIAVSAAMLLGGSDFHARREMVRIGDVKRTTTNEQTFPPHAAGVAMAAGVLLLVGGARKRG